MRHIYLQSMNENDRLAYEGKNIEGLKSTGKQKQVRRMRDRKMSRAFTKNRKLFYSRVNSERRAKEQMEMKM